MTKQTLADRIQKTREQRGMNQSQLAKILKVSSTAVWNWEKNGIVPRAPMMKSLAKALGVTEAYLQNGETPVAHRTTAEIIAAATAEIAALNGIDASKVKLDWQIVG